MAHDKDFYTPRKIQERELAALKLLLEVGEKQQEHIQSMVRDYRKRKMGYLADEQDKIQNTLGIALHDVRRLIEREYKVDYFGKAKGDSSPESK